MFPFRLVRLDTIRLVCLISFFGQLYFFVPVMTPYLLQRNLTIAEIAGTEGLHNSYVSRLLNLTLLAPDIIEALLDGRQPPGFKLAEFTVAAPDCWLAQRREFYGHRD